MTIILCEGPDGTGKTTLAKNEFPDYEYIHNGVFPTPMHAYNEYKRQISQWNQNSNVFVDRQHISERIYGSAYHGVFMDDMLYHEIDNMLYERGAIVVLCLPKYEVSVRNWASRASLEMLSSVNDYWRIYQKYESMLYSSNYSRWLTKLPIIAYDYLNPIDLRQALHNASVSY